VAAGKSTLAARLAGALRRGSAPDRIGGPMPMSRLLP